MPIEYNPMGNITCFDQSIYNTSLKRDVRNFNSSEIYFKIDYVGCSDKNNATCIN